MIDTDLINTRISNMADGDYVIMADEGIVCSRCCKSESVMETMSDIDELCPDDDQWRVTEFGYADGDEGVSCDHCHLHV